MYINCCCCKICIWCWRKKSKETLRKERKQKKLKELYKERRRLLKLLRDAEHKQK